MIKRTKWYALLIAIAAYFGYNIYAVDNVVRATTPTTNTDGSPLTNLASLRYYKAVIALGGNCSAAGTAYTLAGTVPATVVSTEIVFNDTNQNTTGRYCYRVSAVTSTGAESVLTAAVFKEVDLRVPNPPTNVTVN
jgi:hypothetical protein